MNVASPMYPIRCGSLLSCHSRKGTASQNLSFVCDSNVEPNDPFNVEEAALDYYES